MLPLVALLAGLVGACGGDSPPADGAAAPRSDVFFPDRLDATAPAEFTVRLETSEGPVRIRVVRAWSPHGADRFYNLVRHGFYDDTRIYRVVDNFVAQFGVAGDPLLHYQWRNALIPDDPVVVSNLRGRVTFARPGPDARTTEVFVNLRDNPSLDDQGFSPIGEVVEGMEAVNAFHAEYGDGPPRGDGPYQARARAEGNIYLDAEFPGLTRIRSGRVEGEANPADAVSPPGGAPPG